VRPSAPPFIFQHLLFPLNNPIEAYVFFFVFLSSIFISAMCFRRQFLHKMWPIQFAFLLFIACMIFLFSLNLSNTLFFTPSSYWPYPFFFPALHLKTSKVFVIYFSKSPHFWVIYLYAPNTAFYRLNFKCFGKKLPDLNRMWQIFKNLIN
jgi:hypothetical protein